jgi:hypothetical protein
MKLQFKEQDFQIQAVKTNRFTLERSKELICLIPNRFTEKNVIYYEMRLSDFNSKKTDSPDSQVYLELFNQILENEDDLKEVTQKVQD